MAITKSDIQQQIEIANSIMESLPEWERSYLRKAVGNQSERDQSDSMVKIKVFNSSFKFLQGLNNGNKEEIN